MAFKNSQSNIVAAAAAYKFRNARQISFVNKDVLIISSAHLQSDAHIASDLSK